MDAIELLCPVWPAPANVIAGVTTRVGGISKKPYAALNMGGHVGDDEKCVASNRAQLEKFCRAELCSSIDQPGSARMPSQHWHWLNQTHGTRVATLEKSAVAAIRSPIDADAAITHEPHTVCVVLTADCLPILLCDRQGTRVGVVHAGWRGLLDGVVDNAIAALCSAKGAQTQRQPNEFFAWLGPAIGPQHFIVGEDVKQRANAYFRARSNTSADDLAASDAAFTRVMAADPTITNNSVATTAGKYTADIYQLATLALYRNGVKHIYGGGFCTVTDHQRFFSYRRDGDTGRMASFILLSNKPG